MLSQQFRARSFGVPQDDNLSDMNCLSIDKGEDRGTHQHLAQLSNMLGVPGEGIGGVTGGGERSAVTAACVLSWSDAGSGAAQGRMRCRRVNALAAQKLEWRF